MRGVIKMKFIRFTFLSAVIFLLSAFLATAQISTSPDEEKYFQDKELGGECSLISSKLSVDGQTTNKTFSIEVPTDGEYFLSAWIMNTGIIQKNNGLKFFVDDQKTQFGNLNPQKEGWQCAKLLDNNNAKTEKLSLTAGIHYLTFCSTVPEVPPVEFIRLSRTESGAEISDVEWSNYIEAAKKNILSLEYVKLAEDSLNNGKLLRTLPNPNGDYLHQIDINFTYTYYTTLYFYAGANVVLETKKADPYSSNPVMHFFNADDPVNKGSWGDDNSGEGMQAKITCTVQYTGYYYVLVRSFWPNTVETTDLYLYDNLYASNIAVAGTGFRCDHTLTQEINYFTSFLTGDSRLWVESYETGLNGRILGYNDDYYGSGDFSWGYNARVKKSYSQRMWNCFVSRYSSYNPTGTCDLYMRCKNSTIMSSFPNLKADDAIRSAPEAYYPDGYNCISWSGGITEYWEWPLDPGSVYYVSGNPLASFDNYYRNYPVTRNVSPNTRSWNYYRSGATSSNNQIDLWSLNGSYTHASVNARWSDLSLGNPANDNPHGYDWESKPGGLMRTFHPRYALSGNAYGNVDKYYKNDGTYVTLAKRIAKESVIFSDDEKEKLNNLIAKVSENIKNEFDNKYTSWKETWTDPKVVIQADPRKYAESDAYYDFLSYCKKQGNIVLPLVIHKFNEGDFFAINAIEDLSYNNNKELMDEVKNENIKSGVSSSLKDNWMSFSKKILLKDNKFWGQIPDYREEKVGKTSTMPEKFVLEQNYPNPFNPSTQIQFGLPSQEKVTLKIYDILGKEVAILVNNEVRSEGWHTALWNGEDNFGKPVVSGIYFCRLITENNIQTIKLVLIR